MEHSLLDVDLPLLLGITLLAFVGGYLGMRLARPSIAPPLDPKLFERQLEACIKLHKQADLLSFATRRHLVMLQRGETPDPAPVVHVLERFVANHADNSVILPVAVLHALSHLSLRCLPAAQGRATPADVPALIEGLDQARAEVLSTMRRCLSIDRLGAHVHGPKAPPDLENFAALDAFHRELMARRSRSA